MTHVVTSRPIPAENDTSPTEANHAEHTGDGEHTVNPALLAMERHVMRCHNPDVLYRARQMGMKIWALEKLQRMISTINDGELSGHSHARGHNTGNTRARGDNDLSQVLRNELVNGPSDRDPLSAKEMVMFKGPFIYVHDMDEKTKPVMVREYPKVARRQDGPWPQFRSAPLGKCPFIEEPLSRKESRQRSRQPVKEKQTAQKSVQQSNTRKAEAHPEAAVKDGYGADTEVEDAQEHQAAKEQAPAQKVPAKQESPKKSSESFIPPQVPRAGPFFMGREPAASGVQPSNVTSAIRSQMISSNAAGHGAKAGVSKEVHELKRKVLEKGNGNVPTGTIASTHPTDPSALRKNPSVHLGKANPQQKLGLVHEGDTAQSESHGTRKRRFDSRKENTQNQERRRDPKPGYCENCREKFDDFEDVS